jgi:hypothetical protein
MPGPIQSMLQSLRQLWSPAPAEETPAIREHPEVIVHDPAAQGPHDLDDPFFDSGVQSRIADVIASAGKTQKK